MNISPTFYTKSFITRITYHKHFLFTYYLNHFGLGVSALVKRSAYNIPPLSKFFLSHSKSLLYSLSDIAPDLYLLVSRFKLSA